MIITNTEIDPKYTQNQLINKSMGIASMPVSRLLFSVYTSYSVNVICLKLIVFFMFFSFFFVQNAAQNGE